MKLLLTAILLILVVSDVAWSRTYWVDNKSVCENSRGIWREYGNSCANNCQSQVQNNICTMGLLYSCDCGLNRCWDGDKCANFKLYKAAFDEEEKERLEDEAEDWAETLAALPPPATTPAPATVAASTATPKTPSSSPTVTKSSATIAPGLDQKSICLQKSGDWKAFINSCVNSCDSKITTNPTCSPTITFGCNCGDNKCWDNKANQCSTIEDYRRLNSNLNGNSNNLAPNPTPLPPSQTPITSTAVPSSTPNSLPAPPSLSPPKMPNVQNFNSGTTTNGK